MLVKEVIDLLNAREIYIANKDVYDKNYDKAFASDLMSDALALLKDESDEILFITGLANVQSLRTAEVLDIDTILFVRGKPLDMSIVDMAKDLEIIFSKLMLQCLKLAENYMKQECADDQKNISSRKR